jgi:hypothetical protein
MALPIKRAIEFESASQRAESILKNTTEVTKVVLISKKVYILRNTDRKAQLVSGKAVPRQPMYLAAWESCVMAGMSVVMMVLSFEEGLAYMDTIQGRKKATRTMLIEGS